MATRRHLWLKL